MRNSAWRLVMVGLVVLVCSLTLVARIPTGIFSLEGDAADSDFASPPDDWQTLKAGGGSTALITWTNILDDMHTASADSTAFFSNQTKDTVDIPGNWTWKATSVPDKDDLNNAYAAAYRDATSGHTIITFGADRFSSGNGTAYLGFWFFQAKVAPAGTGQGTFSGQHTVGDMLVLVNFSGGGTVPKVQVLEWVNSGGDVSEHLKSLYANNVALCGPGSPSQACAITNASPVALFWPFAYKGQATCTTAPCTAPAQAFFEGAVDLNEVFGDNLPCITSFLAETRSSDSVNADLKDFIIGTDFNVCSIGVSKTCGSATPSGGNVAFSNTITVTNTGAGLLHNVLVTDKYETTGPGVYVTRRWAGDCTGLTNCTHLASLETLASGSHVDIPETFTATMLTATDSATAAAAPSETAERGITAGPASATCSASVTPAVLVTKVCDKVELVPAGDYLVVKVTVKGTIKNTSTGTNIKIKSITDSPAAASGTITADKSELAINETANINAFYYYPKLAPGPSCDDGTLCFSDVLTVNWEAVLGGQTGSSNSGYAICPLCKPGCGTGQSCQPQTVSPFLSTIRR